MKKYVLVMILFFLGIIFFNFGGNEGGSKGTNVNKKLGRKNESTFFKIPTAQNKSYDKQSIMVKFKPGITKIQRNRLTGLVSGKFKDRNNDGIDDRYRSILGGRLAVVELEGNRRIDLASIALPILKKHPGVEYAEYNYRQSIIAIPNDSLYTKQWGMNNTGQNGGVPDADIDAPEAWDINMGNSEIIVGVIDTGIDYTHEDLVDNTWINPNEIPGNGVDDDANGYIDDIHGIDSIMENGDPMDDHSHGTHCSGIIGAVGNNGKGVIGINPAISIIGLKFLASDGYGLISDAIECINYAVWLKKNGINIRILSNSWGGDYYEQSLADAINEANNEGILFTAAAGNDTNDNDVNSFYPANYPHVLAVAATDSNDDLSWFSNYGASTVHLGAPGSDILSTVLNNGYETYNGTSMAAPHVSGAAALLLSFNDQLTVQQLKDYLMNYGDPLTTLNGKTVSGNRLNLYNSLSQVPIPPPSFKLSAAPASQVVEQGQAVSYAIDIQSTLGYSSPLTLSVSTNPVIDGTIIFTNNPVLPGTTSLMTVETTPNTIMTDYIIKITADDGSIKKTTSVLLKVSPIGMVTVSYTNDTVIPIPDNNSTGITSIINIPDPLKIWEIAVTVNVTHPYIGDLIIELISPSGTKVVLHNMEGGGSANIHKTYYLTQFRDERALGAWKLVVSDLFWYFNGNLDNWTLKISGVLENPLPPHADFSGVPRVLSVGRSVNFSDLSSNYPTGHLWTFNGGNPAASTLSNPKVTYNTVGIYDVSLTVNNRQGNDTKIKTGYITVVPYQPPPVANFTTSASTIIEGKQISFTDKSTQGPTTWSWSFPGGNPAASNLPNPTVTYDTMGIYNVSLTVSNPGGENTKTKKNFIQVCKLSKKIGLFDFSSTYDRALVFDYNGDYIDDLFLYRPGSGVVCVVRSNGDGTFSNVYHADGISASGIGLYDLRSIYDQVIKFDYNGDGNDDLFFYRPGRGAAGVIRSNGDGTFTSVYNIIDNGSNPPNGIGGYDLLSSKDRVLALRLDWDNNEDLLLYRPSRGAVTALTSLGDGTFRNYYNVIDNGADIPNGICWFDLLASNDKALAFNYNGGSYEGLLLYRAGSGAVSVVISNGDGTFRNVYSVIDNGSANPNGIGGYNLLSTKDQVLTFDYNADGAKDLLLYRPGRGAISIVRSNWDETFGSVYKVIDNGTALPNGICGFDLLSTSDQALIFDYNGDSYEDICFYRPGRGAINIICSNADETFTGVYNVIDNGSTPPNGIGGYNLLSVNDRVLAYDFDGDGTDGLFLYRPGEGLIGIIPCKK